MKIIDSFVSGIFTIMFLDEMPESFTKVKIDGTIYDVLIPCDKENCIAVESNSDFKDKDIEFVE